PGAAKKIATQAERVVANSKATAASLDFSERLEKKIEVVYNGVRLDRFHPDNKTRYRKNVRKRLGIPEDVAMFLFVGSGFERKGLEYLVRAVGLLDREDWRLVLVGKGDWNRYLRFVSEATRKKIVCLDPVDDIETLYAAADLFVLPSIYEPFGNANLEALASGLPIITSRDSGASEIVTPKKDGMVVEDPSDPKAIAEAIGYLMDPDVRGSMARSARLLAERFTQERNAEAMLKIYRELTGN
ncbi:MAG: glycosyltransferase family 4 protein, partial [Nitrospinae bacterium]|nr:glycosyltransferase family 4 protein [Nitrospinota bacterium]